MKKLLCLVMLIFVTLNLVSCGSVGNGSGNVSPKWKNAVVKTSVKILSPVAVKVFDCEDQEGLQNYIIERLLPQEPIVQPMEFQKGLVVTNLCKLVVNKGVDLLKGIAVKKEFMQAGKCSGDYAAELSKTILYKGCDIIPL